MPKINENALEQSEDSMQQMTEQLLQNASMQVMCPVFVCGVNRKVNTGNFENIDVYSGLAIPLIPQYVGLLPTNTETLREAVGNAAEIGFGFASEQTGQRYQMLKELQKNGRPPK